MTIASVVGAESRGGRPYLWADPAAVPIIPVIPLDVLEELTAAGASLQVVMVACRAIARMVFGGQGAQSAASSCESVRMSPLSPEMSPESPVSPATSPPVSDMRIDSQLGSLSAKQRKRLRDRLSLREKRAAKRAAPSSDMRMDSQLAGDSSSDSGDSVVPLSLKEDSHSSRERERESRSESPVSRDKSDMRMDSQLDAGRSLPAMRESAGLMTLPLDWQPTEAGAKFVRDRLGEVAAADCLAKFRVYFIDGDGKDERRTATGWHARWRKWGIDERIPFNGAAQRSLPLMGTVGGGAPIAPATAPPQLPPAPDDPLWTPVRQRLAAELPENIMTSWFNRVRLEVSDGTAMLALPTRFLRSWIQTHYEHAVMRAVAASHPGVTQVRFVTQQRRESG